MAVVFSAAQCSSGGDDGDEYKDDKSNDNACRRIAEEMLKKEHDKSQNELRLTFNKELEEERAKLQKVIYPPACFFCNPDPKNNCYSNHDPCPIFNPYPI